MCQEQPERRILAMPRFRISLLAACATAAALPTGAEAVVSCDYDAATKQVDVTMTANENYAHIQRNGAQIRVSGFACVDGNVAATVNNTDKIVVADTSGGGTTTGIDTYGGPFAPGATAEPGATSEIEFEISGGQGDDTLQLVGGNVNDDWDLGAVPGGSGANLNAGDEVNGDVDVTTTGINDVSVAPGDGDDKVNAAGVQPFDGPLTLPAELEGGDHDDTVFGGNGPDLLEGGTGDDILKGRGGLDELHGDSGKDFLDGDEGDDIAEYEYAPSGVTVDLRLNGYQDTGGAGSDLLADVEHVRGSGHADVLIGNESDNILKGRGQADRLVGNGGDDLADGDAGDDTAAYGAAPAGVTVSLATGVPQNTVGAGTDEISEVENLVGSGFDDTLSGNGAGNVIEGGGGADEVNGNAGPDTLKLRDGVHDVAACGDGIDTVITDEPGKDTLAGCENVDALPAPVVEDPPADKVPPQDPTPPSQPNPEQQQPQPLPGDPTQPAGGTAPARDTAAPVISALKRRGGRIVFRSSEKARVSVLIARDRGRRSSKRFRTVRTLGRDAIAGQNRVRLPRGLKAGRYRALVVATDAAGNRSKKVLVAFRIAR
jgi:Ca2+-binding RTX toxin-like protein